MKDYSQFKLGRRVTKARPMLKLADYVTPALAPAPGSVDWVTKVKVWGMLGNDTLGNCVEAEQLHLIEAATTYADGSELVATNEEAIKLYTAEGGYMPGDPNTDNGTDMLAALEYWQNTGIEIGTTRHKIDAWVSVNMSDPEEMHQAIYLFGGVFYGVDLPISAQTPAEDGDGNPVWEFAGNTKGDNAIGSWGGHAVPLLAYYAGRHTGFGVRHRYRAISWNEVFDVTPEFMTVYGSECYAPVSADWIGRSGAAPNGLSLDQLLADMKAL
jgi:hypothetical protein